MKLLVTGGAGFIGSHFIRQRLARYPADQIVNLDGLTYAGSQQRLTDLERNPRYHFMRGDICDGALVRRALEGCEAMVHCAAETHVDRSITNGTPFLRTNVEGTYVMLHQAQAAGTTRVIHISTDEVYGPVLRGAVDERAPLAPRSPYAASKAAGDLLAQAFGATHGLPIIVVRPTNIFGPAQFPEKFIPVCITSALQQQPIPLYGDGQQCRGWLFVTDACAAIDLILQQGRSGEVYNIGSGSEQTNLDVAKRIVAALAAPQELIRFVTDRPGHDRRYAMQDAKLRRLGWQPTISFDQGLAETIAWYRQQTTWWQPLVQRLREDPYHWLNRTPGTGAEQTSGAVL